MLETGFSLFLRVVFPMCDWNSRGLPVRFLPPLPTRSLPPNRMILVFIVWEQRFHLMPFSNKFNKRYIHSHTHTHTHTLDRFENTFHTRHITGNRIQYIVRCGVFIRYVDVVFFFIFCSYYISYFLRLLSIFPFFSLFHLLSTLICAFIFFFIGISTGNAVYMWSLNAAQIGLKCNVSMLPCYISKCIILAIWLDRMAIRWCVWMHTNFWDRS